MSPRKKSFFSLYFLVFMDNFGFSVIFTLLGPLLLLPIYGMIPGDISFSVKNMIFAVTFGAFPLTQFFGAPLIGDFADHFGRKKAFYLTIFGSILGFVLSGISVWLHSVLLLIISRLISGFFAGNLSICLACIADLTPDEKARAKNYSHVVTIFGVSWILAMALGGYLANPLIVGKSGPMVAFFVTALLFLLNLVAIAYWFSETYTHKKRMRFNFLGGVKDILEIFHLKKVRLFFIVYFLWTVGWGLSMQWYPPYSIEIYHASVVSITTWMIVLGIAWALGSSFLNHWMLKRLNSFNIASIGNITTAILVFVGAIVPTFFSFSVAIGIASIFSAFTMCNTMNLISTSVSEHKQGKVMGLSQSALSFGWIVGSIITFFLTQHHLDLLYIVAALMLLIGSISLRTNKL